MLILGIETSCDETAAAVVKDGRKILSNVVASSSQIHSKTGGIIPEQAARRQSQSIVPVIKEALSVSKQTPKTIDALAVTVGPGLIGSLLVGVETAKTLAYSWKKPIIPVNHLAAHLYANWLGKKEPKFPAIGLVVSGGHTDLVHMKGHGKLKWLGGTRDDAAGEAFDKTARLLGLGYPGGPAISSSASRFLENQTKTELKLFPRPMINTNDLDFSFSGLKTAVLNYTKNKKINQKKVERLSAEIQEAIVDVLAKKTSRAVEKFKPKSLLVAGGVAANSRLREKLLGLGKSKTNKLEVFIPRPELCTDNASYIASYAEYGFQEKSWKKIITNPQLAISG